MAQFKIRTPKFTRNRRRVSWFLRKQRLDRQSDDPLFSLDATKNVTLSVGNLVERWDDERNNGLFVEQTTGGFQPLLDGDKITFDGVDDYMEGQPLTVEGDVTVVIKFQATVSPNFGRLIWTKTGGTGTDGFYVGMGRDPDQLEIRGSGGVFFPSISIVDFSASINVLTVVFRDVTVYIYVNGVFNRSSAIGIIQQSSFNTFIGSEDNGTQNFNGDIHDLQVYDQALTQAEITKITQELS